MKTANSSNRSGFESLLRVYRESDLSQEKVRILSVLDLKYTLNFLYFYFEGWLMVSCISFMICTDTLAVDSCQIFLNPQHGHLRFRLCF